MTITAEIPCADLCVTTVHAILDRAFATTSSDLDSVFQVFLSIFYDDREPHDC